MDADTRHALKQNELAEALSKLRNLDNPTTRYILIGLAVLIVLVGAWKLYGYAQGHALETGWKQFAALDEQLGDPDPAKAAAARDELRKLAASTSNSELAGHAWVRYAGACLEAALKSPEGSDALLRDATQALEQVTSSRAAPLVRAAAWFALGTAYEGQRAWDKARQAYEMLTAKDGIFAASPFVFAAQQRLSSLGELAKPIVFAPGSPPAPEATAGPQPPPGWERLDPALVSDRPLPPPPAASAPAPPEPAAPQPE